ncbi:MAG: helix-turn-helix domain-containing protein [Treponema sp.]|nr:helix-turn-helix domain-containing protein [Treponema sp.]
MMESVIFIAVALGYDNASKFSSAFKLSLDFPGLTTNYESISLWIYTERRDLIPYLVRTVSLA